MKNFINMMTIVLWFYCIFNFMVAFFFVNPDRSMSQWEMQQKILLINFILAVLFPLFSPTTSGGQAIIFLN